MKQSIKISAEFEVLSENEDGFLISGFSTALSPQGMVYGAGLTVPIPPINISKCGETNNCNGGNCVSGCGSPTPSL